jgi:putative FmdB family regulatory protein
MPFYDFKCSECDEIFSVMCRISDRESQACPSCNSIKYESHHTSMPAFGDPIRLGVRTIDDGFREVLSRVGSANGRQADLSDKLSRR